VQLSVSRHVPATSVWPLGQLLPELLPQAASATVVAAKMPELARIP